MALFSYSATEVKRIERRLKKLRKVVGSRLKAARTRNGVSQEDVAKELCYLQPLISKYESGAARLGLGEFIVICKLLELEGDDIIEIMFGEDRPGSGIQDKVKKKKKKK